jgi:hypothetical protein
VPLLGCWQSELAAWGIGAKRGRNPLRVSAVALAERLAMRRGREASHRQNHREDDCEQRLDRDAHELKAKT